jgi:polysaccharide deacetylase family protein (PEP-CTERM system associated)
MINALSVDLEYWWSAEFFKKAINEDTKEDLIVESICPLLHLLDKHGVRSTFFVLGLVAEKYPEMVDKLYDQGHEIAFHGYSHKPLHQLDIVEFERELDISMKYLSKFRPIGYRAPSFSLNNGTNWALRILANRGFKYDSSIFPARIGYYGVPNAPLSCYRPSQHDIAVNDPYGTIKEIPLSVIRLGRINFPIAGGFYLRALPLWILKKSIDQINKERPAVIYIHPWETFAGLPRLKMNYFHYFVNYCGNKCAMGKLENLLKLYKFRPIKEIFL